MKLLKHIPRVYSLRGFLHFPFIPNSPSFRFNCFQPTLNQTTTSIPFLFCSFTYFTTTNMDLNTKGMDQLSLEAKPIPMSKKKEKKEEKKFTLKTPKGTTDFGPEEMALRTSMFQTIQSIFERHGAVTIDTPVFELKELLQGKYGEDSKLIYDLEDQGGELCSLRYDLTVPFARFMAMHGKVYPNLKRYHIGKVYRRDQPAMQKGRRREFYQCDLDIAGMYDTMVPDAEILMVMVEILSAFFDPKEFVIKLNHRSILNAMFESCGVPCDLFKAIASSIDKLDKCEWNMVKKEMIDKGITESVANQIGDYVHLKGGKEVLTYLKTNTSMASLTSFQSAVTDMELLFKYLEVFGIDSQVSLDLSLARGLDYYTGVIFEAVLLSEPTTLEIQAQLQKTKNIPSASLPSSSSPDPDSFKEDHSDKVGLGSIAAGGRYDELVGMFMGPSKKGVQPQIPCVGMSIGIERLFSVLWQRQLQSQSRMKSTFTQVYVMAIGGNGFLKERMEVCQELWHHQIAAEFMYKLKPRLQAQFTVCEKQSIPLAIILGEEELNSGVVKMKDMTQKVEGEESGGSLVPRSEMITEVKRRLGIH